MLRPTPLTARVPTGRPAPRGAVPLAAAAAAPAAAATTAGAEPGRCNGSSDSSMQKYERLLQWAAAEGTQPAVAVVADPYGGRCLRATQAVPPGGVLLSVPMSRVFASKVPDQLQLHWSADQAVELLRLKHLTHQRQQQQQQQQDSTHTNNHSSSSSSSSSSGRDGIPDSGGSQEVDWSPWLDCLPAAVATPLEFDDDTTQQLGLAATVQDVVELQEVLGACYGEVQGQLEEWGAAWPDFLWAVQVLHSRCFYEPTLAQHLCVPGVDMANHAFHPSAAVRIQHNPGMVQGLAALEEVAPVESLAALAAPASYFQLVAGTEGLQEGQEVSISYGPWPAEVFTTLFGFVPTPNPHDHLVLYTNLLALAQQACEVLLAQLQGSSSTEAVNAGTASSSSSDGVAHPAPAAQQPSAGPAQEGYRQLLQEALTQPTWEEQLQEQLESAAAADGSNNTAAGSQQQHFIRLVATAEGLDARLGAAYQAAMSAVAAVLQRHLEAGVARGTTAAAAAAIVPTEGAAAAGTGAAPSVPSAGKEIAACWLQQQLQGVTLHTLVTQRLQELQQQVQPAGAGAMGALPAAAGAEAAGGGDAEVPQEHLQLVQAYRQQKSNTAQRVLERMAAQPAAAATT